MTICDFCGFDWDAGPDGAIDAIASVAAGFDETVGSCDPVAVRRRILPSTWSALEYTAHTRDALAFYGDRIHRVVVESRPQLTSFGFHEACERLRYNDEPVDAALDGLRAAAERLVRELTSLPDSHWSREGIGSEGGARTVLTLACRAAHESAHHLADVRAVVAGLHERGDR